MPNQNSSLPTKPLSPPDDTFFTLDEIELLEDLIMGYARGDNHGVGTARMTVAQTALQKVLRLRYDRRL